MRVGTILVVNVEGDKRTVDVQLAGSPEQAIDVSVPLGVQYDLVAGDQVLVYELESNGDQVALPGGWFNAALSSDFVALVADVVSLKDAVEELQGFFDPITGHGHTETGGTTTPPLAPSKKTVTIVGSNKLKATHD